MSIIQFFDLKQNLPFTGFIILLIEYLSIKLDLNPKTRKRKHVIVFMFDVISTFEPITSILKGP